MTTEMADVLEWLRDSWHATEFHRRVLQRGASPKELQDIVDGMSITADKLRVAIEELERQEETT